MNNTSQSLNEHQIINGSVFHITSENHNKALHLLEEIKRQSGGLANQDEAYGHVIHSLAETVMWMLIEAVEVAPELS
jgi:hypothetical protein